MDNIKNGWLSVYKPCNITSSKTVLKIKKKFNLHKVGHAGTLDPKAEGVLPIAFGNATKISSFVTSKKKKYSFIIKWGEQTTTDDTEGDVIFRSQRLPNLNQINKSIKKYIGQIDQIPPMYSSIKINGIRAYKMSRQNIKFKLVPRKVDVFSLIFIKNIDHNKSLFNIECGSGFYIRSLARDLGHSVGSAGHIYSLKRQQVGIFNEKNTILLDDLLKISHLSSQIKGFYHSLEVLDDIPALALSDKDITNVRMGKKIDISFLSKSTLEELNRKKDCLYKKLFRVNRHRLYSK